MGFNIGILREEWNSVADGHEYIIQWTVPDLNYAKYFTSLNARGKPAVSCLRRQAHCSDSFGGPYRARTGYLHIANVALYQMS